MINSTQGQSNINTNDSDEVKLNQQLIDLAWATKELTKDIEFNRIIIESAKESGTETVYYSQLKEKAPEYYNKINQKLTTIGTSIEMITATMTYEPLNPNPDYPETAEVEIYEPSIMVPNSEILDQNKIPLISPNIEKVYNKEVYIKCWFYKENGEIDSTLIGEETWLISTNPIFILNHSIPYDKMKELGDYMKNNKQESPSFIPKNNTAAKITEIQIKDGYGYEEGLFNWNSEFCINAVVVYNNGPANFIYLPLKKSNADYSIKIRDVHEAEVGGSSLIPVNEFFSPNYSNNTGFVAVYWNTFERDWNRSAKVLGFSESSDPYTWYLQGNMRYSHNWYMWIPSTTRIHAMQYHWFGWEPFIKFENWKSSITIAPN